MRTVSCTLCGESFDLLCPARHDLPCDEPIPFQDIEVARNGSTRFIYRHSGGVFQIVIENNQETSPNLWADGWDRLGIPPNAILRGEAARKVFGWLRAYEIAGPGGSVEQWRDALSSGRAGWRDLEVSRPDLLTVPILQEWKTSREKSGRALNRRGRPMGSGGWPVRDDLDLHAYEIREDSRRHGRLMTWEQAVQRALKDAPPEIARGIDRVGQEAMVARLQKGKVKEKWLKFQATVGKPPPP